MQISLAKSPTRFVSDQRLTNKFMKTKVNRLKLTRPATLALLSLAASLGFTTTTTQAATTLFSANFDAATAGALGTTASTAAATLNAGTATGTWSFPAGTGFGAISGSGNKEAVFAHNTSAISGMTVMPENGVAMGGTYPVTKVVQAPGTAPAPLVANLAVPGAFTGNNSVNISFNVGSFGQSDTVGFKYFFVRGLDASGNEVFDLLWVQGSTSATSQIFARSATDTSTTLATSSSGTPQGTLIASNLASYASYNSAAVGTLPASLLPVSITLTNGQVTYVINGGTPATFAVNSGATSISKLEFSEVWNSSKVDAQNAGFWLDNISVTGTGPDVWTGATSASWNTAGNWSSAAVPATGDLIAFNSSSTANLATTLDAEFSIGALTLTTPAGPVSIGGANTLTVGGSGIDLSAASQDLTISAPLVLATNQSYQTWNVASAHTLSVNGGVSGSSALNLPGSGTVLLGGAATYTGDTTVSAGTLRIGAANALPNGAGTGKVNLNGGTLDLNGNILTINGLVSTYAATAVVDNLAAGAVTLTIGDGNSYGTFDGSIQNTAGPLSLVKAGAGQLFLRGTNSTYSGSTTILDGSVKLGTAGVAGDSGVNRLPATTVLTLGDAVANTGGKLLLNARPQTLAGLTSAGSGANSIVNGNGGACALTLNNTANYTFSGTLGGSGANENNFSLVMTGSGTLTLSGTNTYTGATAINAGTLLINSPGSLASGSAVTAGSSATLGGGGTISGAVTVNAGGTLAPGNGPTGTLTLGASPTLNGTLAFAISNNVSTSSTTQGQLALGANNLTYGGALTVAATGDPLVSGDSFPLVASSGTLSGWFSSVTLPALGAGLSWDTNDLATSGVLDVYTFTTTPLALSTPINTAATVSAAKLANHVSSGKLALAYPGTGWSASATPPASGGSVVINGDGSFTYTPGGAANVNGGTDSFTVNFNDGHGSQSMAVSVTVGTSSSSGQSPNILTSGTDGSGNFYALFAGAPSTTFTVETNSVVSGGTWVKYANYTSGSDGLINVTNVPPTGGSLFFRTVYPSY
jgi:autotransporter-associated beta strand protein